MAFSPDGSFAVSAAPSERHVAVWACDQSAPSASKKAASASSVSTASHQEPHPSLFGSLILVQVNPCGQLVFGVNLGTFFKRLLQL
jgi:hypothetical protein